MKEAGAVLAKATSWKIGVLLAIVISILLVSGFWVLGGREGSSARVERLLEEIRRGPHPELAKLLLVAESLRDSNFQIVFDGTQRDVNSALAFARGYLWRNYHGEKAEAWTNTHLYRSPRRGEVIYLKATDGSRRPLRDVFLEELQRLPL